MAEYEEDFVSRWSRRKVESRQGLRKKDASEAPERAATAVPPVEKGALQESDPIEGRGAEQVPQLTEADVEKLTYESDFTEFLKEGVPDAIQRLALRKLWASNPAFGAFDGLDDCYRTGDFTDAACAVPNVSTAWRVGRGYMTDAELEAQEEIGLSEAELAALREKRAKAKAAAAQAEQTSAEEEGDTQPDAKSTGTETAEKAVKDEHDA